MALLSNSQIWTLCLQHILTKEQRMGHWPRVLALVFLSWCCQWILLGAVDDSTLGVLSTADPETWKLLNPRAVVNCTDADCRFRYIDSETMGIRVRSGVSTFMRSVVNPLSRQVVDVVINSKHHHSVSPASRLAVMIIFAIPIDMPLTEYAHRRLAYLYCSLSLLYKNVGVHTPIDVFVWMHPTATPYVPSWLYEHFDTVVIPIQPSLWKLPEDSQEREKWNCGAAFNDDYYLMGRWRLTFAMSFVRDMGYEYMLQMDDDTFILHEIPYNIVERFQSSNGLWGIRRHMFLESKFVLTGLPEFTKYWMLTRNMTQPLGELFDHLTPSSLEGLSSEGWDFIQSSGCFQIINVPFWHDPVVQDYLQVALKSGSVLEQRWQEQGIQNMIRLLFVPAEKIYIFADELIVHGKPSLYSLQDLHCPAVHIALNIPINVTQLSIDENVVITTIVNPFGHREIVNFHWNCREHEHALGSCANVTSDLNYAIESHIAIYAEQFCDQKDISMRDCLIVLEQAIKVWKQNLKLKAAAAAAAAVAVAGLPLDVETSVDSQSDEDEKEPLS